MRTPNPANWNDFPEKEALVLFAQALMEALFDHTVDSFKAPALNVHSLALEARSVASDVVRDKISPAALAPVLEELLERMGKCPVLAKQQCGSLSAYKAQLTPKAAPREVLSTLQAMAIELGGSYWDAICREISQTIREAKPDRRIIDLAHAFVCEAELIGFTREDVYLRSNAFFFLARRKKKIISSVSEIDEFLKIFRTKKREKYSVTFMGDKNFFDIEELCKKMGISIENFPPENEQSSAEKDLSAGGFEAKIIVGNVSAMDVSRAREFAESRLQFAVDIHRFCTHKYDLKWKSLALVETENGKKCQKVKPSTAPVLRGSGAKSTYVQVTEEDLVQVFANSVFSDQSVRTMYNVLQYHRAALDATTPENQLLDLWAAIEGLTPTPHKDAARITYYISQILPSLTLTYTRKIFTYVDLCIREHSQQAAALIDGATGHGEQFLRTAAILVCADMEAERDALVAMTCDNPLLQIRMRRARDCFSTNEKTRRTIEHHRKWIGWHLQRIYSSRNRISHSAMSLPYLETLVENLHSYVDVLVSSVVKVGRSSSANMTLESALRILSVHEVGYLDEIKGAEVQCNKDNFVSIVFGRKNPLSPIGEKLVI